MKEITGDLFDYPVIVIPTNGIVKADGRLVMGAGVAKQAKEKFKGIDKAWGKKVKELGNIVHYEEYNLYTAIFSITTLIFSFPTKQQYKGNSDINLIESSTKQLLSKVNLLNLDKVYLPKVGCGLGNLNWNEVKPLLERYLDDRFIIVTKT